MSVDGNLEWIMEKYNPLITYGETLYSDNTVAKRYVFSLEEMDEFSEVWAVLQNASLNPQGCLKTFEIKYRVFVDFDEYLNMKLGEEE